MKNFRFYSFKIETEIASEYVELPRISCSADLSSVSADLAPALTEREVLEGIPL